MAERRSECEARAFPGGAIAVARAVIDARSRAVSPVFGAGAFGGFVKMSEGPRMHFRRGV
eukprot:6650467-Lingulodinium_polyedra.AAC.1